jgi:hypothetical protein
VPLYHHYQTLNGGWSPG